MTIKVSKPAINLREKLNELEQDTGLKGQELMRAETVAEARTAIGAGRRNMIINGDFQISQRGDYTSATAMTSSGYFVDRWRTRLSNSSSGLAGTVTHSARKIRIDCTSAGTGSLRLDQKIEINDDVMFTDKVITLSAMVKSNDANSRVAVYTQGWHPENAAHSGSGGWEKLSLTFNSGTLVVGNEFSVQVGIDGDSSANLAIPTSSYVEIKEVQLELGSVATEFEHRSYGEELVLCQRYYQKSRNPDKFSGDSDRGGEVSFRGYTSTGASSFQWYQFPMTMRSAPTITIEGTGPNDLVTSLIGTNGFRAGYNTDDYHYNFYYYADAEL